MLNDNEVEELPHSGLDMAVFHRPQHPHSPQRKRGIVRKIFKSLFVALVLVALGVGAMCTFDEVFRMRCKGFAKRNFERAKAWINGTDPNVKPAPVSYSNPDADPAPAYQPRIKPAMDTPSHEEKTATPRTTSSTPVPPPSLISTPAQPTIEQTRKKVWELFNQGIAAEKTKDFAGAVRAWEAIKALPVAEDDLPLNLDARIAAAKRAMK